MLNTRLRKQIEWHFFNYEADAAIFSECERDVIDSALTANYGGVGVGAHVGNPTEKKALLLLECVGEKNWFTVVRNTFTAFRFKDSHPIMKSLYIERRDIKEILCDGIWETTFYRWRDEWLEYAYKWAKELDLL